MILRQHFTGELLGFTDQQLVKQGDTVEIARRQYLVHSVVAYVEDITPSGGCSGASGFAPLTSKTAERRGQHKDE